MPTLLPNYATLAAGILAGAALTLLVEGAVQGFRHYRRRRAGPSPKAQLHIFSEDGGHFLSAKLPSLAVQTLLEDFHAGRLA